MAQVITSATNFMTYLNTLLELDSTAPVSGDEDFTVWLNLANAAVNLWENEEGMLWKELFVKLADASDGDKTSAVGDWSYTVPTNFKFPNSAYVWLGTGVDKVPYKIIRQEEFQLYETNSDKWCYFLLDPTPTLEFNPNLTIPNAKTISYNYYKTATALTTGSSTFEMSDPMFAVYYALAELTKEEGNAQSLSIATQKLEAMKTKNEMGGYFQSDAIVNKIEDAFGV